MNAKIITFGVRQAWVNNHCSQPCAGHCRFNFMVGIISPSCITGNAGLVWRTPEHDKGIYKAISNGNNTKICLKWSRAGQMSFRRFQIPDGMLLTAFRETAKELIEDAAMRFDFLIIIDGSEELNNPISSAGLSCCQIYVIHSPSVKDCLWQLSMSNTIRLAFIG